MSEGTNSAENSAQGQYAEGTAQNATAETGG